MNICSSRIKKRISRLIIMRIISPTQRMTFQRSLMDKINILDTSWDAAGGIEFALYKRFEVNHIMRISIRFHTKRMLFQEF